MNESLFRNGSDAFHGLSIEVFKMGSKLTVIEESSVLSFLSLAVLVPRCGDSVTSYYKHRYAHKRTARIKKHG